uniref:Uncharacterized protein n=1 Tax=Oryza glumipatula TaxID=40148 RepID=A0A0D9Y863_9ORYZ
MGSPSTVVPQPVWSSPPMTAPLTGSPSPAAAPLKWLLPPTVTPPTRLLPLVASSPASPTPWNLYAATPKSTAQQLTSVMCLFRGGSSRNLPVSQAGCMSLEAQGSSRRGSAAELRRSGPLLLFSLIWKFGSLDWLASTLLEMVSLLALHPSAMYWGLTP